MNRSKKLKRLIAVALAIASLLPASSCAFKPTPHEVEAAAQQAQTAAQAAAQNRLDGRILGAKITWEGQAHPLLLTSQNFKQKAANTWEKTKTVSFPVSAPESFFLELNLAQDAQSLQALIATTAVTTGDDLKERKIATELIETTPAPLGAWIKLRLTGMDRLFSDHKEQRVYLKLQLKTALETPFILDWTFSTPPSKIALVSETKVFRQEGKTTSPHPDLNHLTSQSQNLELIEIIHLRNDSFEDIGVSLPFKSHGTIRLNGTKYWAAKGPDKNAHLPTYNQQALDITHSVLEDFYVFPLKSDLSTTWTSYSQKNLDSLRLSQGEDIELGLYVDHKATQFIREFPFSRPQAEQLTTGGHATCPQNQVVLPPVTAPSGGRKAFCLLPPLDSLDSENRLFCSQVMDSMQACIDSGFSNQTVCDQAALGDDELYRRRIPNLQLPTWYGCRRKCGDGNCFEPAWEWVLTSSAFQVGVKTEPVTINWEDDYVPAYFRFLGDDASTAAEARTAVLIQGGVVVRD